MKEANKNNTKRDSLWHDCGDQDRRAQLCSSRTIQYEAFQLFHFWALHPYDPQSPLLIWWWMINTVHFSTSSVEEKDNRPFSERLRTCVARRQQLLELSAQRERRWNCERVHNSILKIPYKCLFHTHKFCALLGGRRNHDCVFLFGDRWDACAASWNQPSLWLNTLFFSAKILNSHALVVARREKHTQEISSIFQRTVKKNKESRSDEN